MTDLSRASAPDDGVARRTILAGAAWSIPVIATATVAPAASASGTLALAFNQASYTGTACSTITDAYVTATTNGSPTVGASITVTLSNGYTFAGGSATYTGSSDASGRVSLPAISVPSIGGTSTLQGISGTASSSATATGTPAPATITYYSYTDLGGIPSTATITDVATCSDGLSGHWGFARTSEGNIYSSKNGSTFTLFASDTTHLAAADSTAIWSKTDNKVTYYTYTDLGGIPRTATITDVATCSDGLSGHWGFARTSDGNVYSSKNGSTFTLLASSTTHLAATDGAAIWAKTDNKVSYYSYTDLGGIPTTATITDVATCDAGNGGHWAWALTSDGTLYSSLNGSTFTANTTNVTHIAAADGANVLATSANKMSYYTYGNLGGIPTTATITDVATCSDGASGHWGFARTSDGNVYSSKNGSTFTLLASNTTHLAAADSAAIWSKTQAC